MRREDPFQCNGFKNSDKKEITRIKVSYKQERLGYYGKEDCVKLAKQRYLVKARGAHLYLTFEIPHKD